MSFSRCLSVAKRCESLPDVVSSHVLLKHHETKRSRGKALDSAEEWVFRFSYDFSCSPGH